MTDLRRSYPVTLQWAELWPDRFVPLIRGSDLELIEEFLDYAIYRAREKVRTKVNIDTYKSTVEPLAYALLDFARFLRRQRLAWRDINDAFLTEYRNCALCETQQDKRCKDAFSAMRTVNKKLRIIYDFYAWAEIDSALTDGKIGWTDGDIRSTLPLHKQSNKSEDKRSKNAYPLCYTGIGEKSRTLQGQYWATEKDLDDIELFLRSTQNQGIAERNILFIRTVDEMGWRRGSVNSLRIGQFSDLVINRSIEQGLPALSVVPPVQKNRRAHSFKMEYPFAWEINRYITAHYGGEVAEKSGHDKDIASLPLFTSMRSKHPLKNQTFSEIFGAAFRAIGAPVGANIHSVRRKFAEETVEEEFTRRKQLGLSIAQEDVADAVAEKLGHDSKLSQEAYLRVAKRPKRGTVEERQGETISKLTAELLAANAEIAQKEALIKNLSKSLHLLELKAIGKRHLNRPVKIRKTDADT